MELPDYSQGLLMERIDLALVGERQLVQICAVEPAELEAGGEDVPKLRLGCMRCVGLIGKLLVQDSSAEENSIGVGIDFVERLNADAGLLRVYGRNSDGEYNCQSTAGGS